MILDGLIEISTNFWDKHRPSGDREQEETYLTRARNIRRIKTDFSHYKIV